MSAGGPRPPEAEAPAGSAGLGGMTLSQEIVFAVSLALLGVALYARCFTIGLVGDDYTLLDAALRVPLPDLLTGRHGILGYYRPVSRELYFWLWGRLFGAHALGYHAVNALTYAGTTSMLFLFVRRWQGRQAGFLAALAWVLFPPGGALLSWVSCAQDLIALFWCAAALLLYQSRRHRWAGVAVALAALSKETAVVMPFVLVAYEWALGGKAGPHDPAARIGDTAGPRPREPAGRRWLGLLPAFLGLAAALALSIAMRLTWPPGTAVAVWAPAQIGGAWQVPFDFLTTFAPSGTVEGIAAAWHDTPALLVVAGVLAFAAVPGVDTPSRPLPPPSGDAPERTRRDADALRRVMVFSAVFIVLGLLPVGVIVARWRGYFFSLSALGSSLVLARLLERAGAWPARAVVAVLAIVNFGSNTAYRPTNAGWGPGRHAYANFAFFKETSELSAHVLGALMPWSPAIVAQPRTFVVGSQRSTLLENVTGPALRVLCRDTVDRVRFLDAFTPADAPTPFGVLRFDPDRLDFEWSRADAPTRVEIGIESLILARYDVAAACFGAAAAERPDDPELNYLLAASLAVTGHVGEARDRWAAARARGRAPSLTALAEVLGIHGTTADGDTGRATTMGLVAAVLADPAAGAAHAALGRLLLGRGAARPAALELSVACGLGAMGEDFFALGEAYLALGDPMQAREAYRRALDGPLDPTLRGEGEHRLAEIEQAMARAGGTPR